MWNISELEKLIFEGIEENLNLEYKGAGALEKIDGKKKEITKDVSAMANSAGGVIIYGIKEFDEPEKRHLPEKIDPIERTSFSKEWLEQVINTIRPRVDGLQIFPVNIENEGNKGAYVVEIPQSTTAHQATDHRYYKRYNFESIPMEDYEVKDVINRLTTAKADVKFDFRRILGDSDIHEYTLIINVSNQGFQAIKNFKLKLTFPNIFRAVKNNIPGRENASITEDKKGNFIINYWSRKVLFPEDTIDINEEIAICYVIDQVSYNKIIHYLEVPKFDWILYADDMFPKIGSVKISELINY